MKKIFTRALFVLNLLLAIVVATNISMNVSAATSGDYALKVGGESNDNVNINNGNYLVTGDPGQVVELKLLVVNKAKNTRNFIFY
ncbi:hypothetical protein [Companilactobacillus muriivasis]|uniref:hypothetical protein n=1 Tax=Companilactobacillus muriivasis TaxID=3081444 RepID=UPI0030C7338E